MIRALQVPMTCSRRPSEKSSTAMAFWQASGIPIARLWSNALRFALRSSTRPKLEQPFGQEAKDFLAGLIAGKELRLDPIGKQSTGYMPVDPYKRILCMAFLTERMDVGAVDYYHEGKRGGGSVKRARPVTRNIELEMIVNGWAWVAEQYTFDRETE